MSSTGDIYHSLGQFLRNDTRLSRRAEVARFVKVDPNKTVKRWADRKQAAVGESLIRLRYFLELKGYRIPELESLEQPIYNIGKIFAFDVANLDDIIQMFEFEAGHSGRSQTLDILHGKRGTSRERLQKARKFGEAFGGLLQEKIGQMKDSGSARAFQRPSEPDAAPRSLIRPADESHVAIMDAFTASMRAILPLAEYVLSNSFTAEERDRIRSSAGKNASRLSLLLTQLSNEAARSALTKQQ